VRNPARSPANISPGNQGGRLSYRVKTGTMDYPVIVRGESQRSPKRKEPSHVTHTSPCAALRAVPNVVYALQALGLPNSLADISAS
jgi:hypothetical protein